MKTQKTFIIDKWHFSQEDFKERMTTAQWRAILLSHRDRILVKGIFRQLQAKSLGFGVVEVSKVPIVKRVTDDD
jgi:hypothetical protein